VNQNRDSYPSPACAWFTVGILTVAYVFSFVDRQILNLLVGPIRKDLGISDTQMSLLMGFSFAVFYTFCGIPLGRLTDSRSRRVIIAAGVFTWSLMTAGCGLARHYWQFLVMRMGVGVGEASLSPSAYSLIADSFPRESRATAISVYSMGIYVGAGLAFVIGGVVIKFASAHPELTVPLVGAVRPWQLIFIALGAAGILFSLALPAIREPARQGVRVAGGVPLHEVWAYLRQSCRAVMCHNLGFAMLSLIGYSAVAWMPSHFIRNLGWNPAQSGLVLGSVVMVFGTLGVVGGGRLSYLLSRRRYADANMRTGLIAAIAGIAFLLACPLISDPVLAAACFAPATICFSMPFGVAAAAIQEMMPNPMRGQTSAIYLLVVNLIGLGLGPTAVAMTADYVFHDDKAVNFSLLLVDVIASVIAVALLRASLTPYRESLERLRTWTAAQPAALLG
jgi:MFS family permease